MRGWHRLQRDIKRTTRTADEHDTKHAAVARTCSSNSSSSNNNGRCYDNDLVLHRLVMIPALA